MRCEGEVAAARALLLEEKALGQDLVRKHRAELDGLKNDIAEKVTDPLFKRFKPHISCPDLILSDLHWNSWSRFLRS